MEAFGKSVIKDKAKITENTVFNERQAAERWL